MPDSVISHQPGEQAQNSDPWTHCFDLSPVLPMLSAHSWSLLVHTLNSPLGDHLLFLLHKLAQMFQVIRTHVYYFLVSMSQGFRHDLAASSSCWGPQEAAVRCWPACSDLGLAEEESASRTAEIISRQHPLAALGLRSTGSCWLLDGAYLLVNSGTECGVSLRFVQ